jgi:uncharacterized protein with GYD domain
VPKYLLKVSYTTDGVAGLAAHGGSERREVVTRLVEDVGGTLEAFYFAWGDVDAYLVVDVPTPAVMVSLSLSVNQSGATTFTTVPLLTPEELDAGAEALPGYLPPGG